VLRRQSTTRRLGTDVLAAAGALSKALSAFSSASQALTPATATAAAAEASGTADGGSITTTPAAGASLLLTPDFVAAARGLSEALAALLPSAAALADADPGQGAAAAAAASEAVAGLKTLQGQMASAVAAAKGAARTAKTTTPATAVGAGYADTPGDLVGSAFAALAAEQIGDGSGDFGAAAAQAIDIPGGAAGAHAPHAAHAAHAASGYNVWGTEGASVGSDTGLGNSFSFTGVYGSGGGGSMSRRHSMDGPRPSFVAAAGGDAVGAQGSPVLMRMPSSRRRSAELPRRP
jgi:hypothetical protein